MKHKHGEIKRVAMIGHKKMPSREGGVEIVVEELSTRMVKKGIEVTCYNRKGHHVSGKEYNSEKHKEYKGVKIKEVFTLNKRGFAAVSSSFFASIRAAFGNYDIVHFHAEGPCTFLWIPKLLGKRCIATIHGLDHQRAKWGRIASYFIMSGEKCAVRHADEIIVLSEAVQQYFRSKYNCETVFIPNGVNRPQTRKANKIKEKYGLTGQDYILFLARIVPEKGLKYLIEAFRNVKTDKKLIIAGGASDTNYFVKELKEMAKGDERIIFTGFVQGECLEELYSNAYVYILPSDLEGMPLSLLEAMSFGNCCLTSDIEECSSVVEDKGVVFRKGDTTALAEKMQFLCNNPNVVCDYKTSACDFICNKYDWNNIVERTIGLYNN